MPPKPRNRLLGSHLKRELRHTPRGGHVFILVTDSERNPSKVPASSRFKALVDCLPFRAVSAAAETRARLGA